MAHRPADALSRGPRRQGILADDLTGAGDSALQFLTPGLEGEVWVLPELHDHVAVPGAGPAVLSVNCESRHLLPAEAAVRVDRAARFLARVGCTHVYQKIDSTLRGNLPVEALQILRTLDLELAVIAPAFPQAGRVTVGGYQLVDSVPVNASAYGRDPITPVKHAHLPTLLAEHADVDQIALVELREVMRGAEAVLGAIVRAIAERKRLLVVDAARPEDLTAIARAMALAPYRLLPVGSAGLAGAIATEELLRRPHHLLDTARPPAAGHTLLGQGPPVLVAAGSLNPVTLAQVAVMRNGAHLVELDVRALLLGEPAALERAIGLARQALLARRDVILTTAASEERVRQDRLLARDLAMGTWQVGAQLAAAMGEAVARLVTEAPLAGLILAGGDTAMGVCRALDAGRGGALRITGELMPAMPVARLDMPTGPLRVVTKSGGFGGPDALVDLARRLKLEQGN